MLSIFCVCRVLFLRVGKVVWHGLPVEFETTSHPVVRQYSLSYEGLLTLLRFFELCDVGRELGSRESSLGDDFDQTGRTRIVFFYET